MFLFTLLAVLAFFPMIFASLMTISAIRKREYDFALKSGAVCLACLLIVVIAPKGAAHLSDGCQSYGRFASDC
ncbi:MULTISPECIES: hypothetical protein [unclassified Brucella]|uniref:hypothetical protein n=1 Tax=unclassified Brucella TaxID=2632610 RepID=UPI00084FB02A|nr:MULTISPECIES: hypothetical protein [unclassified Brucella]OEI82471.1 hypothetical protein BA060_14890 [Brucella sp. B13-0095]